MTITTGITRWKVLGIVIMLFGIISMVQFGYDGITLEEGTKQVNCYDEFKNEIIGLECIEETGLDDKIAVIMAGIVFGSFLIVLGAIIIQFENR